MDPSRTYIATADRNQLIFLSNTANPISFGHLLAVVPIDGTDTQINSIEARKPVGYDKNEIPGKGILIHKVDTNAFGGLRQVLEWRIEQLISILMMLALFGLRGTHFGTVSIMFP